MSPSISVSPSCAVQASQRWPWCHSSRLPRFTTRTRPASSGSRSSCRRESPVSFGVGPADMPTLLVSTSPSRHSPTSRPRMRSASPPVYTLAQSKKLMPASRH